MNGETSPDRDRGLFDTFLVVDGRPVEADAHFDRLAGSVREVFGAELPAGLRAEAEAACEGIELGRLRVDVGPGEAPGSLAHTVAASPIDPGFSFPDRANGDALRSVTPPNWSGAHKWADRGWLERVEAELGEEMPLILAPDGRVLEAGRANVFVVADGALITPPADGEILAGTARAATIELAREAGIEVAERPLALADLRNAEDVFLTSSVRGLRPVRRLDGTELHGDSDIVPRLAAALYERWHGTALSALSSVSPVPPGVPPPGRSA